MTRPARPTARGKRLRFWPQWAGGLVAVAASLAALSLPGTAQADTGSGYDQMTGVGSTASAKTVPWTQGILDNTNSATGPTQSANADRSSANPTSPESFMYSQFKNLVVTVSQTDNISYQGITVSWTGGIPTTTPNVQGNFLQMMECWGDASTGPTPEQCQFGAYGLNSGLTSNPVIGERGGSLCTTNTPSTTNPPASADGQQPSAGCDPAEASIATDTGPSCPSTTCAHGDFYVPFSPVSDPNSLDYSTSDTTYFNEFNTDEIQRAVTNSAGKGQQQFETLTGTQASGLGCGDAESDGSARGCWLVIVPRGTYEPNGFQINVNSASTSANAYLDSSPLSASNWAMRIQIHLGFSPVGSFCPPGTLERQTFGTGMIGRAMQSWELALNQAAKCNRVYGYSAVPEATSTLNLAAGGDAGLAFTTIPIGSEATRDGESPPNLPNIVYAPVAVAALDFGFNINQGSAGYVSTPVNLTPLLLAKALTQSYREDLPDYYTQGLPPGVTPTTGSDPVPDLGPSWSLNNPLNISEDPTFQAINPGVPATPGGPEAPLLTEDHSALNQQAWNWIQSSSAATTWLGGTADASDGNMVLDQDKNYQSLGLGTNAKTDSFPRAYNTCLKLGNFTTDTGSVKPVQKCSLDLLPYTNSYQTAAAAVLSANDPDNNGPWDPTATAPDGTNGWWGALGIEPLGRVWMWGLSDTPDLAAYGLIPANLCDDAANDTASNCVSPSVASVTTAVQSATSVSGLLEVNPASPGSGGWPLTQIIYAAVPTNQSAAALTDYANLISYAVGSGQATGSAPGDLPPGYLPLPSNLVTQAQSVVTQLQNLASPSPSQSASSSGSSSTGSSSSAPAASTTPASSTASTSTPAAAAGATGGATPAPAPGTTPNSAAAATPPSGLGRTPAASGSHPVVVPSGSTVPGGAVGNLPPAEAASGSTPEVPVGDVRWALIVVAAAGGAFAGGGTMLRSGMTLPWSRRRPGGGPPAPP